MKDQVSTSTRVLDQYKRTLPGQPPIERLSASSPALHAAYGVRQAGKDLASGGREAPASTSPDGALQTNHAVPSQRSVGIAATPIEAPR